MQILGFRLRDIEHGNPARFREVGHSRQQAAAEPVFQTDLGFLVEYQPDPAVAAFQQAVERQAGNLVLVVGNQEDRAVLESADSPSRRQSGRSRTRGTVSISFLLAMVKRENNPVNAAAVEHVFKSAVGISGSQNQNSSTV